MARARNIKPGFFMDDVLAEIEPLGRILFAGLWCIADREGRLEDRPKRIKAEVLPYDECDADDLLEQLNSKGFIIRYEVDGQRYIQVTKFTKHQNPHVNEKPSEIPEPPTSEVVSKDSGASTIQVPESHSTNPADSLLLIPDSLKRIPDSLIEEASNPNILGPPDATPTERLILHEFKQIKGYPLDVPTDLEHIRSLTVDYPTVDLLDEAKKWRTNKLDKPLKPKSNPRLQFRNWCANAAKWQSERSERNGQGGRTSGSTRKTGKFDDLIIR
jgi:hypothetical protein